MSDPFDAFGVTDAGTSRMTLINPNTDQPFATPEPDPKEAWIELAHLHGPEGRRYDALHEREAHKIKPRNGFTRTELYMIGKLAALTKNWFLVGANGEVITEMPCTEENAAKFYERRWVYLQVVNHAASYGNFTPPAKS